MTTSHCQNGRRPPSSRWARGSAALLGLALAIAPFACANLIGLDEFQVDEPPDGGSPGSSTGGVAAGGRSGVGVEKPGAVKVDENACRSVDDCDDENACTADNCINEVCTHVTIDAGETCPGGVCNGIAGAESCARCLDSAIGNSQDVGCPPGAAVCRTEGDPTCIGCSQHADCDDGNPCTLDTCSLDTVCSYAAAAVGTVCPAGFCNGSQGAEECVACADSASGNLIDAGCTASRPVCDEGTRTCSECTADSHCSDGIGCTEDTCQAGSCGATPLDSLCPTNADACSLNQCQLTPSSGAPGCYTVDQSREVLMNKGTLNGSFDTVAADDEAAGWPASGWLERGRENMKAYANGQLTFACTPTCAGSVGDFQARDGARVAWLGGLTKWSDQLTRSFTIPAKAVSLRIVAHTNFQTKETGSSAYDAYSVKLLSSSDVELATVGSGSNLDAQKSSASWSADGFDKTVAVEAAWQGTQVKIRFASTNDSARVTDFAFDELRIIANVTCN